MTTSSTTNGKEIGINKPTPFTGDRKKVGTFVQEAKVYLTINKDVYNTDDKKIAFMLSYMTDKEALQWKELYLETLTDQTTGDIVFPTYGEFLKDLKEAFKAADRTGESMNRLTNLKQGNKTAEELATEFRLLAGQAGLEAKSHSDHIHLIGLFRNALRPALSRRILFGEVVPKTIEEWVAKAIQYDTNYRMALALTGQTSRTTGNAQRNRGWAPRNTETRDPNAMDVDSMSVEERSNLMRQGACFKCKKRGHLARDCPDGKPNSSPKKLSAKDLIAQIRALTKEEKSDFANLMMDEETGF